MVRLPSMQTLRAFEAAARHRSYSAAARELGVTHGAVSHRIRSLEAELDTTLFERRGRAMVPTRAAVSLVAQVNEALQILARAIPGSDAGDGGGLVVGVHHSFAIRWLIPRLSGFLQARPGIDVEIYSSAELGAFINPRVDVAIRYGAGTWPGVMSERLAGESLFPVCSPAYRDALRIRSPADLGHCHLLRHSWHTWVPWFREAGIGLPEPESGLLVSDSGMLVEAALAGLGIALVGRAFAATALTEGSLVAPFDIEVADSYAYYLLHDPATPLDARAQQFRDWLLAEFGAMTG